MTKDDPFGLTNDSARTRIRPSRGERSSAPFTGGVAPGTGARLGSHDQQVAASGSRMRHPRSHPNTLVAAFATLLEIAPELERAIPPSDPESLRVRMLDALVDSRDAAVAAGASLARADQAAWLVGALIDDIALNTPWGGHSDWPRQPLVSTMYGDVDAGARFFDRLSDMQRHPNRDREMLELAYLCVALGFRGRYRVPGRAGEGSLMEVRAQAARILRDPAADSADLSPNWQGVVALDEPRRFAIPVWTVGLAALALITAIYVGVGMRLSGKAERLYDLARLLPPPERAEIYRPVRTSGAATEPAAPLPEPATFLLIPEFEAAAPSDTRPAMSGREDVSIAVVVLQSRDPEVFRSARADLNEVYAPLVASVASVIMANIDVVGGVTVVGHTDSVPVQASNPFSTNQGLSEARARTIAELLVLGGVPANLVTSEGRAASEPVGDNATREGRAQNRRVEIKIRKTL
jgi:type VI secretion system protein ImpK